jgi:hypothetical protein
MQARDLGNPIVCRRPRTGELSMQIPKPQNQRLQFWGPGLDEINTLTPQVEALPSSCPFAPPWPLADQVALTYIGWEQVFLAQTTDTHATPRNNAPPTTWVSLDPVQKTPKVNHHSVGRKTPIYKALTQATIYSQEHFSEVDQSPLPGVGDMTRVPCAPRTARRDQKYYLISPMRDFCWKFLSFFLSFFFFGSTGVWTQYFTLARWALLCPSWLKFQTWVCSS